MPLVLDAREVEVGQIAAVVDDSLRVGVREADARERRELERRLAVGRAARDGWSRSHASLRPRLRLSRARGNLRALQPGHPRGEGNDMKRLLLGLRPCAPCVLALGPASPGPSKSSALSSTIYSATVSQDRVRRPARQGLRHRRGRGRRRRQGELEHRARHASGRARCGSSGVDVELAARTKFGRQRARQFAALQPSTGFNVWRDYDGPDGYRAQLYADRARTTRSIAKLEVLGHTVQGRELSRSS